MVLTAPLPPNPHHSQSVGLTGDFPESQMSPRLRVCLYNVNVRGSVIQIGDHDTSFSPNFVKALSLISVSNQTERDSPPELGV